MRYGLNPMGSVWSPIMETIEVTRAGGVVTVTLNRPAKKNAITTQMWDELLETFREVGASDDDRALVLTGAGGAFCAGADLWAASGRPRHGLAAMRRVATVCQALHDLPQPSIAKVVGVAAGAGANLALGCDLVVCADNARFSQIFAKRGLTLDAGGSWLLPRLVGLAKAKELAFFADMLSGEQAAHYGLVNRVVAVGEIDAFVDEWANRLASGPPIALAQTKRLLNESFQLSMSEALAAEGAAQTVNFGTKDTAEAIEAFGAKREPTFRGR